MLDILFANLPSNNIINMLLEKVFTFFRTQINKLMVFLLGRIPVFKASDMIDVLPHEHYSFSTFRLLEIAVNNWSFLYNHCEAKADNTTIVIRSERDIDELWKGSINTAFSVKNKVYIPGLFTGNGQDGEAATCSNAILNTIKMNQIKGLLNDCTLKHVWLTGKTTPVMIIDYLDSHNVLHTWPL